MTMVALTCHKPELTLSNSVTTLDQLRAVANATGPQIILIQGNIKGAAKVQVGSNKSIIGKSGSCE